MKLQHEIKFNPEIDLFVLKAEVRSVICFLISKLGDDKEMIVGHLRRHCGTLFSVLGENLDDLLRVR